MKINMRWHSLARRMAAAGLRVRLRPFEIRFDRRISVDALSSRYDFLFASRRRILIANILSGMLIALSVYFLGQTTFFDRLLDFCLRFLVLVKIMVFERRLMPTQLVPSILNLLLVVSIAASFCTFVRSIRLTVFFNFALAGGIIAVNLLESVPVPLPLSSVPVVLFITLGALLDHAREMRFLRRRSKLAADRQETGFAILRHITHSINPTIRTALSPIWAVKEHLREQGRINDVIARRRDGSDERAGEALDAAVVSLGQIRDILDTTEDLFAGRIEERDFVEADLDEIFGHEVLPLFTGGRFAIETDFAGIGKVRLHRPSFVQAVKNLIRNAEVHGFPEGFSRKEGLCVCFAARRTLKEIVIDYTNNGVPFPSGFRTGDFLAFGRKGKNSQGKGLGGAWVAKFVELHGGTFRKISNDPVHFRITLPRRDTR